MSLPRIPAPDEVALHVETTTGRRGPISRLAIREGIDAGEIGLRDHVWFEGMAGWARLEDHPELIEGIEAPPDVSPPAPGEAREDYLERLFGELVRGSWNYLEEHKFASHIDEVFVGALITATLDIGYSLIDITSDGTHHYLRFEAIGAHHRIVVRMTHLTGSLSVARVLGQRADVTLGYGERVGNPAKILKAVQAEMKGRYIREPEPGTIIVDGDLTSGYVYCQVQLFLDLEDYVSPDYTIDHVELALHVEATTHALRKYLRGRFT